MARDPIGVNDELVVQAVAGDRLARAQLLYLHHSSLSRQLARRIAASPGHPAQVEVDDVVQETCLCAFRDIQSCEAQNDEAFAAWLAAVGRHQLTNAVKAARAKKRGGGRVRATHRSWAHSSSLANLVHQLSDHAERPSQAAARQQAAAALKVGLASLPADQRCAMELRYLDGKTENEIAAKMGRTRDAVHGLVQRARSTMRDMLGHSSRWFYRKP